MGCGKRSVPSWRANWLHCLLPTLVCGHYEDSSFQASPPFLLWTEPAINLLQCFLSFLGAQMLGRPLHGEPLRRLHCGHVARLAPSVGPLDGCGPCQEELAGHCFLVWGVKRRLIAPPLMRNKGGYVLANRDRSFSRYPRPSTSLV